MALTKTIRTKPKFYSRSTGKKTVLKKVIRPTYKHSPEELPDELEEIEQEDEAPSYFFTPSPKKVISQDLDEPESEPDEADSDVDQESQLPPRSVKPVSASSPDTQSQIDEINRMIQTAATQLKELEEKKQREIEATQEVEDDPEEFDGISDHKEEFRVLQEQLEHQRRVNKKISHELELVKADFDNEKKQLEKTIKSLKTELHRTDPIQENKFFSLSKEIREAVKAIETIADKPAVEPGTEVVVNPISAPTPLSTALPVAPTTQPVAPETQPVVPQTPSPEPEKTITSEKKITLNTETKPEDKPKKAKEKKLLVTGVALLSILVVGGVLSFGLTRKPTVDEKLVQEYLDGQVQGASTGEFDTANKSKTGIKGDKNAEVSFDQTQWDNFEDSFFGIALQYPANTTERLHNANSITFLRKDSYIMKIQKFTSPLELPEFWEQNKNSGGLNYLATEAEFKGKPTLHLKLQSQVEFPGDRYLVKLGADTIFDIWFATTSPNYATADIQRVEKMRESINFL